MGKRANSGFMAKLIFVMSAFCFVWPALVLTKGSFRHTRRSSLGGTIVTPETDPLRFWGTVAGVLVLAVLLLGWGMSYWQKHQRSEVGRQTKAKKRRRR